MREEVRVLNRINILENLFYGEFLEVLNYVL